MNFTTHAEELLCSLKFYSNYLPFHLVIEFGKFSHCFTFLCQKRILLTQRLARSRLYNLHTLPQRLALWNMTPSTVDTTHTLRHRPQRADLERSCVTALLPDLIIFALIRLNKIFPKLGSQSVFHMRTFSSPFPMPTSIALTDEPE